MAQILDVSIVPQNYLPEIKVSENDNTIRTFKVNIIDDDGKPYQIPSGATATFAGTKPSGLGFTVPCTIDGSAVQFTMENTVCNEQGRFPAEIRLINGEARIGTCNVLLNVEPNPHPDDTTDGDREPLVNEITALLHAIEEQAEQVAENTRTVEQAMDAWTNMAAEATTLPAGSEASASYSEGVLSLGIPAGPEGAPGQDGQDGVGIASVQLNSDYTLTITLTDGRTYTTTSIRGEQGETGLTPDFTIGTVTTLAPGSQATATITGTDEEPVLNLGIPKGDPGDVSSTGYYPDLYAGGLVTDKGDTDTSPYTFRASKALGYRESLNQIVGATVGWNQLVASGATSVTVQSGHKYYSKINNVKTIGESDGTAIAINDSTKDNVIDLTSALGTAIANKAYTLEQSTPGSGIAWLRSYGFLTKDYYEYCQPRLESVRVSGHETTGFNQWDEEWENALWTNLNVGRSPYKSAASGNICCKNPIPVLPNTTYFLNCGKFPNLGTAYADAALLDENMKFIAYYPSDGYLGRATKEIVTTSETRYVIFNMYGAYGASYLNDICLNISDTNRNGEYQPYEKHSYPLDSSLTLRGRLYLDSNNELVADGDVYSTNGSVERNWLEDLDLGTLTWNYIAIGDGGIFRAYINAVYEQAPNWSTPAYCVCDKYATGTLNDAISTSESKDKIVTLGKPSGYDGYIIIRDSAYTDPVAFKSAMSGVMFTYKKLTPSTEQADPYTQIQICDPDGTEQFVDYGVASGDRDVAIPCGHSTFYPEDLKGKLEDIPEIPEAPASNGTYTLQAVRSNSGVTYSWVSG